MQRGQWERNGEPCLFRRCNHRCARGAVLCLPAPAWAWEIMVLLRCFCGLPDPLCRLSASLLIPLHARFVLSLLRFDTRPRCKLQGVRVLQLVLHSHTSLLPARSLPSVATGAVAVGGGGNGGGASCGCKGQLPEWRRIKAATSGDRWNSPPSNHSEGCVCMLSSILFMRLLWSLGRIRPVAISPSILLIPLLHTTRAHHFGTHPP